MKLLKRARRPDMCCVAPESAYHSSKQWAFK
jgi:hypothetical protein